MSNMTKYALEASLKKLLLEKPLDKITINDLTEGCGISRMAFYYHFKDIYDLVEWVCMEDQKLCREKRLTKHGRKVCSRFSRQLWKTNRLS